MADTNKPAGSPVAKWAVIVAVLVAAAAGFYSLNTQPEVPPALESGIVLFRYNQQSESTELREQGFLDTMEKEFPDINILSSEQYLGSTRSSATRRSRQLLEEYDDAVIGICCVNESTSDGCLQTMEGLKEAGKIPFVGFDTTPAMVNALSRDRMDGFVIQNPKKMGYETVKAAIAHLKGESVDKQISTGHTLVTGENVDSEETRSLIFPERFSGTSFKPESVEYTVGVVTKGITHDYWQSVRAGVEQAAKESGNTLVKFEAPDIEDDVQGQIEIVRQMISEKVDAICLAPIDSSALGDVVLEAKQAEVPVVIFDSGLDDEKASEAAASVVTYVSTDNYQAGVTAARCLAAAVKGTKLPATETAEE